MRETQLSDPYKTTRISLARQYIHVDSIGSSYTNLYIHEPYVYVII